GRGAQSDNSARSVQANRPAPRHQVIGAALLDLSTGEFHAAEYAGDEGLQALADEITVLKPREIVVPRSGNGSPAGALLPPIAFGNLPITPVDPWAFELEAARRTLLTQLRAAGLEGFGLD